MRSLSETFFGPTVRVDEARLNEATNPSSAMSRISLGAREMHVLFDVSISHTRGARVSLRCLDPHRDALSPMACSIVEARYSGLVDHAQELLLRSCQHSDEPGASSSGFRELLFSHRETHLGIV